MLVLAQHLRGVMPGQPPHLHVLRQQVQLQVGQDFLNQFNPSTVLLQVGEEEVKQAGKTDVRYGPLRLFLIDLPSHLIVSDSFIVPLFTLLEVLSTMHDINLILFC